MELFLYNVIFNIDIDVLKIWNQSNELENLIFKKKVVTIIFAM
jgi:hypothetical protein